MALTLTGCGKYVLAPLVLPKYLTGGVTLYEGADSHYLLDKRRDLRRSTAIPEVCPVRYVTHIFHI